MTVNFLVFGFYDFEKQFKNIIYLSIFYVKKIQIIGFKASFTKIRFCLEIGILVKSFMCL
jgi:hypothetical protein